MLRCAPVFVLLALSLRAEEAQPAPVTPAAIMAKVAANMENGATARRQYIYQQRVKASIVQSNGEVNRREARTYAVLPHETSTEKKLEKFSGEYREGKKMIPYSEPHSHGKDHSHDAKGEEGVAKGIDAELMAELVDSLVNDKKSPDGIPHDLFPLRTRDLPLYTFQSLGERDWQGRRVLRIGFEPAAKKSDLCVHVGKEEDEDSCQTPWAGEAWVDPQELFPVRIDTRLAKGVPWAVRAFLGTNIKQLGFSITYARAGEGAWFPATYGTEFKLDVLFFYKRTISLSLESSDFRRADAVSKIEFEPAPAQ
jgi:hypothetical protein